MRLVSLVVLSATLLLPGLAAAQDATAPNVRVRVGEHGGFNRVVFDWRTRVPYRVENGSGKVIVHFERLATLDLSRYRHNPPPLVKSLGSRPGVGKLAVQIGIPAGATLRHFKHGTKVVIDVYAPPLKATAARMSAPKPAESPTKPAG
jgi:hypothetical protein